MAFTTTSSQTRTSRQNQSNIDDTGREVISPTLFSSPTSAFKSAAQPQPTQSKMPSPGDRVTGTKTIGGVNYNVMTDTKGNTYLGGYAGSSSGGGGGAMSLAPKPQPDIPPPPKPQLQQPGSQGPNNLPSANQTQASVISAYNQSEWQKSYSSLPSKYDQGEGFFNNIFNNIITGVKAVPGATKNLLRSTFVEGQPFQSLVGIFSPKMGTNNPFQGASDFFSSTTQQFFPKRAGEQTISIPQKSGTIIDTKNFGDVTTLGRSGTLFNQADIANIVGQSKGAIEQTTYKQISEPIVEKYQGMVTPDFSETNLADLQRSMNVEIGQKYSESLGSNPNYLISSQAASYDVNKFFLPKYDTGEIGTTAGVLGVSLTGVGMIGTSVVYGASVIQGGEQKISQGGIGNIALGIGEIGVGLGVSILGMKTGYAISQSRAYAKALSKFEKENSLFVGTEEYRTSLGSGVSGIYIKGYGYEFEETKNLKLLKSGPIQQMVEAKIPIINTEDLGVTRLTGWKARSLTQVDMSAIFPWSNKGMVYSVKEFGGGGTVYQIVGDFGDISKYYGKGYISEKGSNMFKNFNFAGLGKDMGDLSFGISGKIRKVGMNIMGDKKVFFKPETMSVIQKFKEPEDISGGFGNLGFKSSGFKSKDFGFEKMSNSLGTTLKLQTKDVSQSFKTGIEGISRQTSKESMQVFTEKIPKTRFRTGLSSVYSTETKSNQKTNLISLNNNLYLPSTKSLKATAYMPSTLDITKQSNSLGLSSALSPATMQITKQQTVQQLVPKLFTPSALTLGFEVPNVPLDFGFPIGFPGLNLELGSPFRPKKYKRGKSKLAPSLTANVFDIVGKFPKSGKFGISPFSIRKLPRKSNMFNVGL